MSDAQEIKIGKGVNAIRFGIHRETLKKELGEPTEIEQLSSDEDDDENEYFIEVWHYDEIDTSFSFDEEDDWRLTNIASNNDNLQFQGKNIKNMSIEEFRTLIDETELGEVEIEDIEDNHKLLSIIASSINFWFEENKLSEVQWGVLWTSEDIPKWP